MNGTSETGLSASIIVHGDLIGLLPAPFRSDVHCACISYPVTRRASVKDIIESLGPPHTEIGRLVLNSSDIDFQPVLHAGDTLEVFPVQAPFDVLTPSLLRPEPLDRIAFIVDVNAGKLAIGLRSLGFDTLYKNTFADAEIADTVHEQGRIVLSKDRTLLKRNKIVFGRLIRNEDPKKQITEVLGFFGLHPPFAAFSRCLRCNTLLQPVAKEDIVHRLEPLTKKFFTEFHICPDCDRIYWAGSHHAHMIGSIPDSAAIHAVESSFNG